MKKFMKGVRGRQILVSVLAVMVIASGFYRWSVMNGNDETVAVANEVLPVDESVEESAEVAEETDFFALTRYERDCARSEAVELLTVAVEYGENAEEPVGKIKMHEKNAEAEIAIENSVRENGFEDCVAFVNEDEVRVIVKATGLEAEGVSKIKNLIIELTGAKPTAIKISNRN